MHLTPISKVTFLTLVVSIALFPMYILPWFMKSGIQPTFSLVSYSLFSIMLVIGYTAMALLHKLTFIKANIPNLLESVSNDREKSILFYISLLLILIGTIISLILERKIGIPFLSTIFPASMIIFSLAILKFQSSIGLLLPLTIVINAFFIFYVEKTSITAGLESFPVLFSKAIIFWLYLVLSLVILINLNLDYFMKAAQSLVDINLGDDHKIDYPTDLKPFFLLLILLSWSYRHFIVFTPWNMLLTLAPLSVCIFLLNRYSMKLDFKKSVLLANAITALFLIHYVYFMYDLNIFKAT